MLQTLINGLLIGGVYALIAVGLSMIHGVMKIVNFAQGDFLTIGMYFSYILYLYMPKGSLPYWLLIPVAILMFLFGVVVFRTSINRVIGKGDSNYILLTLGLSYLVQNVLQLIFGPNFRSLEVSRELKYGSISFFDDAMMLSHPRLIAFAGALIFVTLITYFLARTDLGRAMRATAESTTVAKTLGINVTRVFTIAFCLGTAFAGIAGLLMTPMFLISPQVGTTFSTIAMCAMVLGGLGNLKGAMIGGIILGLVESLSSNYLTMDIAPVIINTVLMLVLIFRPYGIFGKGARRA
ncbi:MAG: branched-chain amino acid ABC transporter permease [Planctomycetota bacterium]|jgi:branched-chain amino acid transport system permease protein|nr:branched-chain amino acid ABC transporter permease [Planctomycetota bacterium]